MLTARLELVASLEILNRINNTGCLTSIEKDESATKDLQQNLQKIQDLH